MTRASLLHAHTPGHTARPGDLLADLDPGPDWMRQGACRDQDPELFFPTSIKIEAAAEAVRVCASCPVWQQCRAYALATPVLQGVWGGLTEGQRRQTRRRNARSRKGAAA